MVYGGYLSTTMPIDVFPDLDRPRVVILTECFGLSPEEVETLVAQPIEARLLGATGVQAVRSQSSIGLNVVNVEFDWNTDIRAARQVVQERLATLVGVLAEGIRPQMTPPSSIMGQIMIVGLYQRKGPQGGDLIPVEKTGLLAERLDKGGKPQLAVWRPRDRNDVATWEQVPVERNLCGTPFKAKVRSRSDVCRSSSRVSHMRSFCGRPGNNKWTCERLRIGRSGHGSFRCRGSPKSW